MKLLKRPIINVVNNHLIDYPTPINFNYWYNFGLLSAVCLGVQFLTGIFLAMHYTPHVDYAWVSVEHIMRDKLWVVNSLYARKRCLNVFHCGLCSSITRSILWFV
jgi:quinol-cytochrome oxidoreductase complex cytochrome b subunit